MSTIENEIRRLTPTEQRLESERRAHELAMAFAQRTSSPPEHSVEITRNAKGIAQFNVTVRGFELAEVLEQARQTFDTLSAAYPYPNGDES